VTGLVCANDRPLPLPAGLVEEIMAAQRAGAPPVPAFEFHQDDPVRLASGPFADLIGRIQRIDSKGRVQILLDLMGRTVSVQTMVTDCRRLLS
jgi:transcriptional antiterminator RfaH